MRRGLGAALAERDTGGQGGRASARAPSRIQDREWTRQRGRAARHLDEFAGLQAFRGAAWMQGRAQAVRGARSISAGCRCQAFALTGDAHATDPVCHLAFTSRSSTQIRFNADFRTVGSTTFQLRCWPIPKVDGGTRHVEVGRCPWTAITPAASPPCPSYSARLSRRRAIGKK